MLLLSDMITLMVETLIDDDFVDPYINMEGRWR